MTLQEMGRHESALADYTRAIELQPDYAQAHFSRGVLYAGAAQIEQALAAFSATVKHDPAFAEAWLRRGLLLVQAGRLQEAIGDYGRALNADPKLHVVYSQRGTAHALLGEFKRAVEDFTVALVHDRDNTRLLYERGRALTNDGHLDEAAADFTHALRLDPTLVRAHAYRAAIHRHQGRHGQALDDYFAAMRLDPAYALQYVCQCGIYHATRGEYQRAVGEFSVALAMDPGNATARKWAEQTKEAWEKQKQRAVESRAEAIDAGGTLPEPTRPARRKPVPRAIEPAALGAQNQNGCVRTSISPVTASSEESVQQIEKKTTRAALEVRDRAEPRVVETAIEVAVATPTVVEEEAAQVFLDADPPEESQGDEKKNLRLDAEMRKEAADSPTRLAIEQALKEATRAPYRPKPRPRSEPVDDDGEEPSFLERQISALERRKWPLMATVIAAGLFYFFFPVSLFKTLGRPSLQPVHGQAFFQNQPIPQASVVLDPAWTKEPGFPRPHAVVKDDGSFVLSTYGQEDGAPDGEYRVMVTWFVRTPGEDYDGAPSPPNNLPAKYGRFDTSGLAVRIEKGKNEIPALQLR
jgi:tetratricopeptide (TPR) repeat protein